MNSQTLVFSDFIAHLDSNLNESLLLLYMTCMCHYLFTGDLFAMFNNSECIRVGTLNGIENQSLKGEMQKYLKNYFLSHISS